MFFSLILKISRFVAPVSGVGWMSVTESLMYHKLFTCPCEDGHKPRPLCSKECLHEYGSCFPISGSEVRKIAVLCSTDIKKTSDYDAVLFFAFLFKKSWYSTLRHQKLSPNERQEVSVLSSLSCWAWCWWGINSRLQIANAWRLPPATKKSSESNRIRSATQRAWVLDLEASSRREGISTKTSLAQSHSWKKRYPKCPKCLLKLEKQ